MKAAILVGFLFAAGCLLWLIVGSDVPASALAQPAPGLGVPASGGVQGASLLEMPVRSEVRDPAVGVSQRAVSHVSASDGRRFAGEVVTESGRYLEQGRLFVFERSALPGEDVETISSVVAPLATGGRFDLRLPKAWIAPTVYVTVVREGRLLGSTTCAVASDLTIVMPDPAAPSGFEVSVRWTDYKPGNAGMLLQSRKRNSGFGEASWNPNECDAFLKLVDRKEKISGELLLLIGELYPSGRINIMAAFPFTSMSALEEAARCGVDVSCSLLPIRVPGFAGKEVEAAVLWSSLDAAPAMALTSVVNGELRAPLSDALSYRTMGRLVDASIVYGVLRKSNWVWYVEWLGCAEPSMTARVRVSDVRGKPIVGAYGTLVSRNPERLLDKLHRVHAQSDADGWLFFQQLIRGPYDLRVETATMGEHRNANLRVDVPAANAECVIPDAQAARLIPTGQGSSAALDSLRGWFRARGEVKWVECTDPRWAFGQSGFVAMRRSGTYEFVLSLPPWVGRLVADVPTGEMVTDISVPMMLQVEIEGRVVDEVGNPRPGLSIAHAATADEAATVPDWAKSNTDSAGRFRLVLVPGSTSGCIATNPAGHKVASFPAASGDAIIPLR